MKAIIYCRVSTAAQEDKSSLKSQAEACAQFAKDNGYTVARTVKEIYSGAYLFERPKLTEIREEMKRGSVDALIVYTIDRLSRNTAHLYILKEESDRYNTKLIFATEQFDDSLQGRLLQSITGIFAEVEREKIRERCMRGRRTKTLDGTISYRRKLFGYQLDEATGKRVVCPDESQVVRMMFETMVRGGSLRRIAAELTDANVMTPQGSTTWYAYSIAHILKNPAYTGNTTAFRYKHEVRYENGQRKHNGSGRQDASQHIVVPDVTPAIIPQDQFDAVQLILEKNRKEKRRQVRLDYLLRGFITCAVCGRQFSPVGSKSYRAYVCTSKQTKHTNCRTKMLGAAKAETAVWELVDGLLRDPDALQDMIDRSTKKLTSKTSDVEHDIEAINRTILKAETEMRNLVARAESATDDAWTLFNERIHSKQAELKKLRDRRESLLRKQYTKPAEIHAADLIERFGVRIDSLTFQERVTVLTALGLHARWDGKQLKASIYVRSNCKVPSERLVNNTVIPLSIEL
jgi:site-specific DNA recombinase